MLPRPPWWSRPPRCGARCRHITPLPNQTHTLPTPESTLQTLALQVRHQVYIIRTSGARLLALINDVMDAAALRQNKLVLKQVGYQLRCGRRSVCV